MSRAALLVAALVLAGCGGRAAVPDDAVALVGSVPVTKAALAAQIAAARRAYAAQGRSFPKEGGVSYRRVRTSALALLVSQAALEQEAADAHVSVTEARVRARLAVLKQRLFHGDERLYRDRLRRQGLTEADLLQSIRTQLLTAALRGAKPSSPTIVYAPGFAPQGDR